MMHTKDEQKINLIQKRVYSFYRAISVVTCDNGKRFRWNKLYKITSKCRLFTYTILLHSETIQTDYRLHALFMALMLVCFV